MKFLFKVGVTFVVLVIVIVVGAVRNASQSSHPAATLPAGTAASGPDVRFGPPVVLGPSGAAALVQNTGSEVISFTAMATWKRQGTIAATAVGAVNDLRPGQ